MPMTFQFNERKRKTLDLSLRQGLFCLVSECPGLHFRDIQRRREMATGTLSYHLDQLVKAGLLTTVRDGEFLRYYVQGKIVVEEKKVLELARRKTVRHILLFLLNNDMGNNDALSDSLHLSPSTVSWHIKKLIEANVLTSRVTGRKIFYSVNDPEIVRAVLVKHKVSFMDKLVDRFVEMWET
jgi:predicted transcriptional regulator